MKLFVLAGLVIGVSIFVLNTYHSSQRQREIFRDPTSASSEEQEQAVDPVPIASQSIFIPYWNIPSSTTNLVDYDTLIYFGVAPDTEGRLKRDMGYANLDTFIRNTTSDVTRLLTVRMLDAETNSEILSDDRLQRSIVNETLSLVETYGFDGIVLDLEMGVIPFEDTKDDIVAFVDYYTSEVKEADKEMYMTIYGDTFYRGRPYDVQALGSLVDGLYIMAYDFHKSRGEPGPNFPLTRRSSSGGGPDYPYDFKQMITDYTSVVSREKITVLFGMYGYDWKLGQQGLPLKQAQAVPLREIDTSGAIEDPVSKEKYVTYTDDEGYRHELWFEDEESVAVKIEYLKEQGIGQVGYWVWGYY